MEQNTKSVLIADDDLELLSMLSVNLVTVGYRVYSATNGVEALEQLDQHPIDAVVTDCRMPKMDGLELLSVCSVKWPGIPVILFSGAEDDMAHDAVNRGAFAWVRKGSDLSTLLEILGVAVQQSVHA